MKARRATLPWRTRLSQLLRSGCQAFPDRESEGGGAALPSTVPSVGGGGGALEQLFLMRSSRQLHATATVHSSLAVHRSP